MILSLETLHSIIRQRLPILTWLPSYSRSDAVGDIVAGITVGLTLMPQAIAYAGLAGLGPQYGLYSGWMGCLVYILFGTTKQISLGPTALVSLLTFTYTHHLNADMAVFLCFISGCVELICGILQLGFLVDFVSIPVVSGFTSAAAFTIASAQLKGLFGLKYDSEAFLDTWLAFLSHITNTRMYDLILGVVCIVTLILLKKLKDLNLGILDAKQQHRFVNGLIWFVSTGRNALVVLICSILACILYHQGHSPFVLTGKLSSGLPTLGLPPLSTEVDGRKLNFLDMVSELGSGILIVPLISIISNIAISKAFSGGTRVDATQEMIALGLCNIMGSFARSMPVAGAFSRSAVNNASGVRTPIGGLYTSVLILLAISLLTPYFFFIPRSCLAAVIISAVLFMVDVQIIQPMWSSNRRDLIPALLTFFACLAFGVEKGLLVGILVDITILLYDNARPQLSIQTVGSRPLYWVVKPHGYLVFPAVDYVRETIMATVLEGRPAALVLDCSHVHRTDYTAAKGISAMIEDIKNQGVQVIFLNADDNVIKSLSGACKDLKIATNSRHISQLLTDDPARLETGIAMQSVNKEFH